MAEYQYHLLADYHQFYLQDEQAVGDLSDSWTVEAVHDLLALTDNTIGIGTVRNTSVPVTVVVLDNPPNEKFEEWDLVNECSIEVPSGCLVVAGCTDYFPDAARIKVKPGWYRARIYYDGLNTLSEDCLEGKDHYKVILWPADEAPPQVLKRRTT